MKLNIVATGFILLNSVECISGYKPAFIKNILKYFSYTTPQKQVITPQVSTPQESMPCQEVNEYVVYDNDEQDVLVHDDTDSMTIKYNYTSYNLYVVDLDQEMKPDLIKNMKKPKAVPGIRSTKINYRVIQSSL